MTIASGGVGARARALAEARSRAKTRAQMVFGIGLLGVGLIGGTAVVLGNAASAAVESCPQGMTEYKVDGNPINGLSVGASAQFKFSNDQIIFTVTKATGPDPFEDDTFDFTSTIPVDLVLVKGGNEDGNGTNSYPYVPAATSGTGLHPPLNGGNEPPAISHVSFCVGDQQATTTTSESTSTSTSTSASTSTSTSSSTTSTVPATTSSTESTTTTSTVPETTSSTENTTTTSTVPETTSSILDSLLGSTVENPDVFVDQGSTAPSTTVAPVSTSALPFTGSGTLAELVFASSCVVGGGLLVFRRRKATKPA